MNGYFCFVCFLDNLNFWTWGKGRLLDENVSRGLCVSAQELWAQPPNPAAIRAAGTFEGLASEGSGAPSILLMNLFIEIKMKIICSGNSYGPAAKPFALMVQMVRGGGLRVLGAGSPGLPDSQPGSHRSLRTGRAACLPQTSQFRINTSIYYS